MQAFTAAIQLVLRSQTLALNQLPTAVKQRHEAEAGADSSNDAKRTGINAAPPITVLEVVLHTQRLQVRQQGHNIQEREHEQHS